MDDPGEGQRMSHRYDHDGAVEVGLRSRLAGGAIAALLSLGLAAVGTIGSGSPHRTRTGRRADRLRPRSMAHAARPTRPMDGRARDRRMRRGHRSILVVSLGGAVGPSPGFSDRLEAFMFFAMLGLPFALLTAAVVTVPMGVLWAWLVGRTWPRTDAMTAWPAVDHARRDPLIDPHALGAAVGCVVALACALVTGAGFMGMGLPAEGVALVSIGAAAVAGWMLGPRAVRATRPVDWVWITFGMAFITMVVGAIGVALLAGLSSRSSTGTGPAEVAFGIVALSILGMLFFGWVAVPILLVPAAVWSVAMWAAIGRR